MPVVIESNCRTDLLPWISAMVCPTGRTHVWPPGLIRCPLTERKGLCGYAPKIEDLLLVQCDRQLFEKLKALDGNELAERTKPFSAISCWRRATILSRSHVAR
jgi:hypothetical protein